MGVETHQEGEYLSYKISEASLKEAFSMPNDPIVGMLWVGIPDEKGNVAPHLLVTLKKLILVTPYKEDAS